MTYVLVILLMYGNKLDKVCVPLSLFVGCIADWHDRCNSPSWFNNFSPISWVIRAATF